MPMETGKQRSRAALAADIIAGETDEKELFIKHGATFLSVYKGVKHCMNLMKEPKLYTRETPIQTKIWFGKAGQGKTYAAGTYIIENNMTEPFDMDYDKTSKGWFDGYNGEHTIMFDDFRGSSMHPVKWMNLVDGKMKTLPIKGGYVQNRVNLILITCPQHPINWWPKWYQKDSPNNWDQIKRRVARGAVFEVQDHTCTEIPVDFWDEYKKDVETVKIF